MLTAVIGQASDHLVDTPDNLSSSLVDMPTVQINAKKIISDLVYKDKLANEWLEADIFSTEKKVYTGNTEWVVVFFNNKADHKTKQKIYVFLSLEGEYIAVNFTGM